jgi:hypothetical protein
MDGSDQPSFPSVVEACATDTSAEVDDTFSVGENESSSTTGSDASGSGGIPSPDPGEIVDANASIDALDPDPAQMVPLPCVFTCFQTNNQYALSAQMDDVTEHDSL